MPDWLQLHPFLEEYGHLACWILFFILLRTILKHWEFWGRFYFFLMEAKDFHISYRDLGILYIYRLYKEKLKYIDLVEVINRSKTDKVPLMDIFLPPKLKCIANGKLSDNWNIFESIKHRQGQPIFITGEPGSGKTILSRYLIHCALPSNRKASHISCQLANSRKTEWLPLFVDGKSVIKANRNWFNTERVDADYFLDWVVAVTEFDQMVLKIPTPWFIKKVR